MPHVSPTNCRSIWVLPEVSLGPLLGPLLSVPLPLMFFWRFLSVCSDGYKNRGDSSRDRRPQYFACWRMPRPSPSSRRRTSSWCAPLRPSPARHSATQPPPAQPGRARNVRARASREVPFFFFVPPEDMVRGLHPCPNVAPIHPPDS